MRGGGSLPPNDPYSALGGLFGPLLRHVASALQMTKQESSRWVTLSVTELMGSRGGAPATPRPLQAAPASVRPLRQGIDLWRWKTELHLSPDEALLMIRSKFTCCPEPEQRVGGSQGRHLPMRKIVFLDFKCTRGSLQRRSPHAW